MDTADTAGIDIAVVDALSVHAVLQQDTAAEDEENMEEVADDTEGEEEAAVDTAEAGNKDKNSLTAEDKEKNKLKVGDNVAVGDVIYILSD